MPTKQQLESALRNADAAGDIEAARKLANALKAGQYDKPEGSEAQGMPEQVETGTTADTEQPDSFADNALDVLGELAASANRTVTEFVDFLGPDTVNSILSLAGSEKRVPTLTGALERTGIQGGFMEPGGARDAVRAAGTAIPMVAGIKQVPGRDIATMRGAAADLIGAGSAAVSQVAKPITKAIPAVTEAVEDALPSSARRAAELPLKRQSGDVAAAGFKLDDAGRVVRDKAQQNALKAGVDEGAVAMLASANKETKGRAKQMLDVLEKGRGNMEFRNFNPPQRVVGEAIKDRLQIIQNANREAGKNIDRVANTLKGKPVDVAPAVNQFLERLGDEGILFNPRTGALDFSDSTIEGLTDAQNIIRRVVKRLYDTKDPTRNAYKVHTAKKFIDEQVSYGKTQAGLSGRMEGIVKQLRRNLDQQLDSNFPEYDRVNTVYKETRDVIDELQGLAGRKVDLFGENVDKALGTMSRKVLSNYNTGVAMEDTLKSLDDVARRYSTPLQASIDDELGKIISFEAELRRMFPTATKPNTFQGQIGAEVGRTAADMATGNKLGIVGRALNTAGKVFSKDDEAKIQALKDLVSE